MNSDLSSLSSQAGFSQADLARLLGISRPTVSHIATSRFRPGAELLARLTRSGRLLDACTAEPVLFPEAAAPDTRAIVQNLNAELEKQKARLADHCKPYEQAVIRKRFVQMLRRDFPGWVQQEVLVYWENSARRIMESWDPDMRRLLECKIRDLELRIAYWNSVGSDGNITPG